MPLALRPLESSNSMVSRCTSQALRPADAFAGSVGWVANTAPESGCSSARVAGFEVTPYGRFWVTPEDILGCRREEASMGTSCTIVCRPRMGRYAFVSVGSVVTNEINYALLCRK